MLLLVGIVALLFSPFARNLYVSFAALQLNNNNMHSLNATSPTQKTPTITAIGTTEANGSLNWPEGDCTYWANYRYHQLSGYWVAWTGNPDQWVVGARAAGWLTSTKPRLHAILVLMPYVQNAGRLGSVGVVEGIVSNATPMVVHTSLMDWYSNGGGWDKESSYDFTVGTGVYFLWHP